MRHGSLATALALALAGVAGAQKPVPTPKPTAPPSNLPTPPPGPPLDLVYFSAGNQAMRAGKLADAERFYRKTIGVNPRMAAAWANLGLLQSNAKRFNEACASLEKARSLEPTNDAYLPPLLQAQYQAGRVESAEKTARRILALAPRDEATLAILGNLLLARQKFAEATRPLEKLNGLRGGRDGATLTSLIVALTGARQRREARSYARAMASRFPKDERARLFVGDLSAQLATETTLPSDWREAKLAYAKAFALNPKNARAALAATTCAEKEGDFAVAESLFQQLAAKNAGKPLGHLAQGKLLLLRKNYPQAQAELEAAFVMEKTAGSDPEFLVPLGEALMLQGPQNDARAREYLRAAVAVDPASERGRRSLAFLNLRAGKIPEAISQLRALLDVQPNDGGTRRQVAELLERFGKPERAIAQWEELARRKKSDPAPLLALATLYSKGEKWADAKKAVERALLRTPENLEALLLLSKIYDGQGDALNARKSAERALTIAPRSEPAQQALGDLLEVGGKDDELLLTREKWVALVPESVAARWELARLYLRRNRETDAKLHVEALQLQPDAALKLGKSRTETKPGDAESWYLYGVILRAAGKTDDAIKAFTDAARLKPDGPAATALKELNPPPPN